MADQKKDLTGLMDYAKAMQDAGKGMPVPKGSVLDEVKLDKIGDFESLEDYGKANPAPEIPETPLELDPPASEPTLLGQSISERTLIGQFEMPAPSAPEGELPPLELEISDSSDFPTSDDAFATTAPSPEDGHSHELPNLDFSTTGSSPEPAAEPTLEPVFEPAPEMVFEPAPEPEATAPLQAALPPAVSILKPKPEAPQPVLRENLRPAVRAPQSTEPLSSMAKVKQYSEQMQPGKAAVPASFPFSLLITGRLAPEEKERLLDILSRENMGIREIDLETQFESSKILIPRISEYAGIMIVSALRSTRAKMRLGPSDTIFATPDTQDNDQESFDQDARSTQNSSSESTHVAENIPITTESTIPNLPQFVVVDVVTASAALKTQAVETESSPEYQEILEALQRELKYKAYRKGASAILNFSVQLTNAGLPTNYRILVMGSAVKSAHTTN